MDVTCSTCHSSAVPGDRFCAGCGAPIPPPRRRGITDDFHPLPLSVPAPQRRLEFRGGMLLIATIALIMFGGLTALAYAVIDLAGESEASISATAPDTANDNTAVGHQPIAVAELRPGGNAVYQGMHATLPGRLAMAGGTARTAAVMPRYEVVPGAVVASMQVSGSASAAGQPHPIVETARFVSSHPADGTGGAAYHPGS